MTTNLVRESTHFLRSPSRPLKPFFLPRAVAVIGATEAPGSVGRTVLRNLISSQFGGTVFPVNPKRPSVLGIRCYPDIASVPKPVDLAVIVTPAATASASAQMRRYRLPSSYRPGSRNAGPRAPNWNARFSPKGNGAGCGLSARTAWA
ncbi:MAG TPA: CoA-binding protein [Terriglobales bacterium]